ncbi:hypothetical protein [Hymenobacter sp. B81]|uniref:hypothetical protein n=1 Tax=Hymenobacter sp. B81 TaxID=3344878 RepID=UPI0037DD77A0
MNDAYLRSLGFASTHPAHSASQPTFDLAWRYQHERAAHDGTPLFIEHPLGVDRCRLSALPAPLAAPDVFANLALHDRPGLESAIEAFYAAHGGPGELLPVFEPYVFRPYRRAR